MRPSYSFTATIWLYNGDSAWHFITLPKSDAQEIKLISSTLPRAGFGSLRVAVESRDISWQTSIFPDKKSSSYLLPIKKEILQKLALGVDDVISVNLELRDI